MAPELIGELRPTVEHAGYHRFLTVLLALDILLETIEARGVILIDCRVLAGSDGNIDMC